MSFFFNIVIYSSLAYIIYQMVAITFAISAGLAIIVGLLILIFPKLLRIGVGLYLILWGILQLIPDW